MGGMNSKDKRPTAEDRNRETKLRDRSLHLSQSEEAILKEMFGNENVRILVIGGTGAGKSTLLRCMGFGDEQGEVPQSVNGRPGQQDISKVWKHRDLPLFIHDSNGVDTDGKNRIADISKFWDERQASPLFADKVHLIWLVLSATDNRILEFNAELVKLAGRHMAKYNIPLQIIVTHVDQVRDSAYNQNVGSHLDELLAAAGIAADGCKELKEEIVKVGMVDQESSDFDEEERRDLEEKQKQALTELSRKTMVVLNEKQQLTWASAQTVDVTAKRHQTAKLIVSRQYLTSYTWLTLPVPGVNEALLTVALRGVWNSIGTIWGAPPALKTAVWNTVGVWSDAVRALVKLLACVGAAVVGLVVPVSGGFAAALGMRGCWQEISETDFRKIFVTCSLLFAASFLFVRISLPVTWASKTLQEYTHLLQDNFETKRLERMLENVKIRKLIHGLVEGMIGNEDNVVELEDFLKDYVDHLDINCNLESLIIN